MQVSSVTVPYEGAVQVNMSAVCGKPFGPNGESEDNTYARYTPSASLSMTITNPNLLGQFKQGQTFYLNFTEHVD